MTKTRAPLGATKAASPIMPSPQIERLSLDARNAFFQTGSISSCVIGAQAVVPAKTVLDRCIVWDSVVVPEGEYTKCIFHEGGCLRLEEE